MEKETIPEQRLRHRVKYQVRRMKTAEAERSTLLAQTRYILTLGFLFALPVVGGGYLGVVLDNLNKGYSVRWTVSLLVIGVVVGFVNVYLFVRE